MPLATSPHPANMITEARFTSQVHATTWSTRKHRGLYRHEWGRRPPFSLLQAVIEIRPLGLRVQWIADTAASTCFTARGKESNTVTVSAQRQGGNVRPSSAAQHCALTPTP